MTSKELVETCNLCMSCKECYYWPLCESFRNQFGCYPYDIITIFRDVPEAYSDTIIQPRKGTI